jgi:hypothetical protein
MKSSKCHFLEQDDISNENEEVQLDIDAIRIRRNKSEKKFK